MATAVTTRATTGMMSSNNDGGRGGEGGDIFDVGSGDGDGNSNGNVNGDGDGGGNNDGNSGISCGDDNMTAAAATAKVVGTDNNQLKVAAEETVTATARATTFNSKRQGKKGRRR